MKKFLSYTARNKYALIFALTIILFFILWLSGILLNGTNSRQMGLFFRSMDDFMADYLNPVGYSGDMNPYNDTIYMGYVHKQYPPLAFLLSYLLSRTISDYNAYNDQGYFLKMYHQPLFLFVTFLIIALLMIGIFETVRKNVLGDKIVKYLVAFSVVVSAPVLSTLERGNHVLLSFLLLAIFFFLMDSKNKVAREIAIISLALAAALKLTPALAGILLLFQKRWKESIRCAIWGVLLFVLPMFAFEGGALNFGYFIRNSIESAQNHSIFEGVSFSSVLYSYFADVMGLKISEDSAQTAFSIINYVICAGLLVGAVFFPKKWQKVLAVSLVVISIQGHAGDYCSLYLIPSMILFLNERKRSIFDPVILFAFLCFMLPYQFIVLGRAINARTGMLILLIYFIVATIIMIATKFVKSSKMKAIEL